MRSLATNACGTPHRDEPPRSDDPSGREMERKEAAPKGSPALRGGLFARPAAPRGTRLRFKISGCCPLRTLP